MASGKGGGRFFGRPLGHSCVDPTDEFPCCHLCAEEAAVVDFSVGTLFREKDLTCCKCCGELTCEKHLINGLCVWCLSRQNDTVLHKT